MTLRCIWFGILILRLSVGYGQSAIVYAVHTKAVTAEVSPTLWGLFFEDINRGADGGVYAEMVENRSFDFSKPMEKWEVWPKGRLRDGIFEVVNQAAAGPGDVSLAADPKYLAVTLNAGDTVGLINDGFDEGMTFKRDDAYRLNLRVREPDSDASVRIRAFLLNEKSQPVARVDIKPIALLKEWQEVTAEIKAEDSGTKAKLLIVFEGAGQLNLDRISLFPVDTWKGRAGGLRKDLVQALADLHPGFLRFPGGCIVEGNQLVHRYQWKHTIGPLESREMVQSIWADDVPNRQTPDYFESFGLGFFEYFQLCEDIGAAPIPIINCGMSCQFDAAEIVPLSDLQPFIRDALDLIEFANGDTLSVWGQQRKNLGHPAPFNLKYLGIGNENWGPQYAERLAAFSAQIKSKYPSIQLVNATGYSRDEPVFHYMDSVLRIRHADIIDEHFYSSCDWFMQNATRYDHYRRTDPSGSPSPKIFVGEYAAQTDKIGSQKNVNNLRSALAEACFMTGIERNADVVTMASYAPLFAEVNGWQWTPDLIWFDNARCYKTPNYYVQQLFSLNRGTAVVSIQQNNQAVTGQDSCWASAVIDSATHELILKIVNVSAEKKSRVLNLEGSRAKGNLMITTLGGLSPESVNGFDHEPISPISSNLPVNGKKIAATLNPYSLTVIRMHLQ